MRLAGKVALVTGASSGIGAATARTFAREGAKVMIADRNVEGGQAVAEEIRRAGGVAEFVETNIGLEADNERMIETTLEKLGRLDVLHNNAMYAVIGKKVEDIPVRAWRATVDVSLTGYFIATKLALPIMVKQGGGSIINTASVNGLRGHYRMAAYDAVKAAVINFSRTTAIEYARKGVRCNTICPGCVNTFAFRYMANEDPNYIKRTTDFVPIGRLGDPQEIANVALFLASAESSFVTGATIVADGGLSAQLGMPYPPGEGPDW